MTEETRPAFAALASLLILQVLMLGALYTQTAPHPPLAVAPFALGPFLSASIAISAAALLCGATTNRLGQFLTALAVLLAMASFGPQKYFDPAFPQIWPAVITAQIAALSLVVALAKNFRQPTALMA